MTLSSSQKQRRDKQFAMLDYFMKLYHEAKRDGYYYRADSYLTRADFIAYNISQGYFGLGKYLK
jgi:hypothetical protein